MTFLRNKRIFNEKVAENEEKVGNSWLSFRWQWFKKPYISYTLRKKHEASYM